MTVTNQDVKIYRGDTATLSISLTQADGSPFQPAVDAVFKWRLSRTWHSPEDKALVRKELGSGIALTSEGVDIVLDETDTDLVPGLYYHELKIWETAEVATSMTGTVVIKRALSMATTP